MRERTRSETRSLRLPSDWTVDGRRIRALGNCRMTRLVSETTDVDSSDMKTADVFMATR